MAVVKIRNAADDGWIEIGGGVRIIQQDSAPVTTGPGMLWLDTDEDDPDLDLRLLTITSLDDSGGLLVLNDDDTNPTGFVAKFDRGNNIGGGGTVDEAMLILKDHSANVVLSCQDHLANELLTVYGDGAVTMPGQPAFQAEMGTNMVNLPINTAHTILFAEERFDTGNDYDTGTYIFTAPVTGKYFFHFQIRMQALDVSATDYVLRIQTSNKVYYKYYSNDEWTGDTDSRVTLEMTALVDMDTSDTCFAVIYQHDGAAQTDILGGTHYCYFYGYLLG